MYSAVMQNTQMVSAQLTATTAGQEYRFEDVPNIASNNIEIYAIETFSETQLAVDDQGRTVVAANGAASITFTLLDNKNNAIVQDYPYYGAISALNGGFIRFLEPFTLNLTECKIRVNSATNLSANEVCVFCIYYRNI